ncbi:MAG: hypothetical protein AB7K09_22780 [Planctomycetota bacterium]
MRHPVRTFVACLAVCAVALVLAGCSQKAPAPDNNASGTSTGNGSAPRFMLTEKPAGEPISVVAARTAEVGKQIVVDARIQGTNARFYSLKIVDTSMNYCGQVTKETCKTPWDYCCYPEDELPGKLMAVRFVDDKGEAARADGTFEWRHLDRVLIVGAVRELEDGTRILAATGYYRLERPTLDWDITWPAEVAGN